MAKNKTMILAGFWRRLLADILDMLVMAVIGMLLSIPFGAFFEQLGAQGPWIGLAITFLYSGLLQTAVGKGQTLGKLALGIQVLRLDGSYLSLPRSLLRYGMIAFISYNSCVTAAIVSLVPSLAASQRLSWALAMLALAFFLGCSLLVVLHPLKRGLHDLLAGSVVIKTGTYDQAELLQRMDRRRETLAVAALVGPVLLCLAASIIFTRTVDQSLPRNEWVVAQQQLRQLPGVHSCRFTLRWLNGHKFLAVELNADPQLLRDSTAAAGEMRQAAELVARSLSNFDEFEALQVSLVTGYNIGIWHSTRSVGKGFSRESLLTPERQLLQWIRSHGPVDH